MAANWTAFVAGNVLTAAQLNGVVDNFADIAIFNETQSSGTEGGTATSGSWAKRTLNTTVVNNITGCSIATSVVTLPAGTYQIYAQTPGYAVNIFQSRLYDNTNTATLVVGSGSHSNSTYSNQSDSFINQTVVLTGSTNIQLEMRVETTKTSSGLGRGASFGENTVFSTLTIRRIV